MIPEPCGVPDNSETGQGSGKKPDNDVVPVVRHHHKDQRNETGDASTEHPYPVRKLSGHSVYEQVGRRKLVQDTIRHGRFTIIVEQRNYGLNRAKGMDALLRELFFSYSVQDTMTVMHF